EVLADAGEITHDGYAKLLQLVRGADAREHEQVGRFDRPGAQHHPVGFDGEHLTPAFSFHTDGLAILDHDLPDEHPAPHRQVPIVAPGRERGDRYPTGQAVWVFGGRPPQAGGVEPIGILWGADPRLYTGGMEGLLDGRPGTGLPAPDGQGAVRAM